MAPSQFFFSYFLRKTCHPDGPLKIKLTGKVSEYISILISIIRNFTQREYYYWASNIIPSSSSLKWKSIMQGCIKYEIFNIKFSCCYNFYLSVLCYAIHPFAQLCCVTGMLCNKNNKFSIFSSDFHGLIDTTKLRSELIVLFIDNPIYQ